MQSMKTAELLKEDTIEQWLQSMVGSAIAGPGLDGVRVILRVDGKTVSDSMGIGSQSLDEETKAAISELTRSMQLYTGGSDVATARVSAPSAQLLRNAVRVLADPSVRRRTLGAALTIFGRRVTAPLDRVLSSRDAGPAARLRVYRAKILASLDDLRLSHETVKMLRNDLNATLSDAYLDLLGENEDKVLRPRMTELAHRVLDVLGGSFHRALDRFATNADNISGRIVRQMPESMTLSELPSHLKAGFVAAVADYLAVETSTEIEGSLRVLSGQYEDVVPPEQPLAFSEDWYRDVAIECWKVIAAYG